MSKRTILFQGDSITDASRKRMMPKTLGQGYANEVDLLLKEYKKQENVQILNRGISGNRVKDLRARWEKDCIELNPDVLSILIGINDCWRRYDDNDPTSAQAFEEDYRYILTQVKEKTNAKIILCEPFVLPIPEDRIAWREDLDPKIEVVKKLSKEFETEYVAFDEMFKEVSKTIDLKSLAEDGVHPTLLGHKLMAEKWIEVFNTIK